MSQIIDDPGGLKATANLINRIMDLFTKTISVTSKIGRDAFDKLVASYNIGFSEFLSTSYAKCSVIKTLVTGEKPIQLLNLYVNLKLKCGDIEIEDRDLIDEIEKYKNIIVTGLAGTGKSMFMRYLTICRFENSKGKIPLFVELRNINNLTTKNLIQYIYHSCTNSKNNVSYEQFELGLSYGAFLVILDGFDEIEIEHREDVGHQIRNLANRYPDINIVVSSRPDEVFLSWRTFYNFSVEKFTTSQTIELVKKLEYDKGVKDRFIKEIKNNLHKTHSSFLSIPLLATLMLVTYRRMAEISNKIHIFYRHAFETLFREHDAMKEQFRRKLYTDLAYDDFENCFAAFCAISYSDEKFSFSKIEMKNYVDKAVKFSRLSISATDFVKDLTESLCVMQKDGLEITFVHRSFQEYFTALFISRYHGTNTYQLIDKISRRHGDGPISMLFEIAKSKIEREWVLPRINKIIGAIDKASTESSAYRRLAVFTVGITAILIPPKVMPITMKSRDRCIITVHPAQTGNLMAYEIIAKLYAKPNEEKKGKTPVSSAILNYMNAFEFKNLVKVLKKHGFNKDVRFAPFYKIDQIQEDVIFNELSEDDDVWLVDLQLDEVTELIKRRLEEINHDVSLFENEDAILFSPNKEASTVT